MCLTDSRSADQPPVSQIVEQISKLCNTIEVPSEDQNYISMMFYCKECSNINIFTDSLQKTDYYGVGTLIASSLNGEHPDLDWALIEIQPPSSEPANMVSVDSVTRQCILCVEKVMSILKDVNVLAVTSRGVETGSLSGSSVFLKSPYGVSFEEVWTVRLDGRLGKLCFIIPKVRYIPT